MNELYELLPENERKDVDVYIKDKYNSFLRKHNLAVVSVDDFNKLKRMDVTVVKPTKKQGTRMRVSFSYEGMSYNSLRLFCEKYSLPYSKAREVFREKQDPSEVIAHFTKQRNSEYQDTLDF